MTARTLSRTVLVALMVGLVNLYGFDSLADSSKPKKPSVLKSAVDRLFGKKPQAGSSAADLKGGPVHTVGGVPQARKNQPGLHAAESKAMEGRGAKPMSTAKDLGGSGPVRVRAVGRNMQATAKPTPPTPPPRIAKPGAPSAASHAAAPKPIAHRPAPQIPNRAPAVPRRPAPRPPGH